MLGSNSITFNSKTLNRINTPPYASEYLYKDATESYRVHVRHSVTKLGRPRHNVQVTHTTWATSEAPEIVRVAYVVIEQSLADESVTIPAALCAFLTASTNLVLTELVDEMV
jgi:hypothetical protein